MLDLTFLLQLQTSKNMIINASPNISLRVVKILTKVCAKTISIPLFLMNLAKRNFSIKQWQEMVKKACVFSIMKNKPIAISFILDTFVLNRDHDEEVYMQQLNEVMQMVCSIIAGTRNH